jgi:hypothetical protein
MFSEAARCIGGDLDRKRKFHTLIFLVWDGSKCLDRYYR